MTVLEQDISLIYRSVSALSEYDSQDCEILTISRERNKKANVTGYLHKQDYVFCQYLEGPEKAVNAIYNSIKNDKRHLHVTLLRSTPCAERLFQSWEMGFSSNVDQDTASHFRNAIAQATNLGAMSHQASLFFESISKQSAH